MSQGTALSRLGYASALGTRKVRVVRIFVAGGTGVVGRRLVPQLVARGHEGTATTTSPTKLEVLQQLGAEAVVMDGLGAGSVGEAGGEGPPGTDGAPRDRPSPPPRGQA